MKKLAYSPDIENDDDIISLVQKVPPDFDIREYLTKKGIEFKEHEEWLQMKCILPDHDEKNPSFFINIKSLAYNCYVCGSGNWFQLCEKVGWIDWKKDNIMIGVNSSSDWDDFKKGLNRENKVKKNNQAKVYFPKTVEIKDGDRYSEYLRADRNNLHIAIEPFGIKASGDKIGVYKNRVIIPVYSNDGKRLLWWEGRALNGLVRPKYYRPDGCEKNFIIFNYASVINKFGKRKVIVVEGIIDAITLYMWGYPAVCIFGSSPSTEQLELLLVFDEIYICLDIDKAGIKGFIKMRDNLSDGGIKLKRIIIPRGMDANRLLKSKFYLYYSKAKEIKRLVKT